MAPPTHVGAWSMAVLLGQPFEYYYVLMDKQLMAVSGNVIVASTDIRCSDHFLGNR